MWSWTLICQLQKPRPAAIEKVSSLLSGEEPFIVSRHAVYDAILKVAARLVSPHLNHPAYHSTPDLLWRLRSRAMASASWRHRRDYAAPDSCLVDSVDCDAGYLLTYH